jgi:hypothetical protein
MEGVVDTRPVSFKGAGRSALLVGASSLSQARSDITQRSLRFTIAWVSTDRLLEAVGGFLEALLGAEDEPQVEERFVKASLGTTGRPSVDFFSFNESSLQGKDSPKVDVAAGIVRGRFDVNVRRTASLTRRLAVG